MGKPYDWTEAPDEMLVANFDWTELPDDLLVAECLTADLAVRADVLAVAAMIRTWMPRPYDEGELRQWDIARFEASTDGLDDLGRRRRRRGSRRAAALDTGQARFVAPDTGPSAFGLGGWVLRAG
jgi:hypothetical protein